MNGDLAVPRYRREVRSGRTAARAGALEEGAVSDRKWRSSSLDGILAWVARSGERAVLREKQCSVIGYQNVMITS